MRKLWLTGLLLGAALLAGAHWCEDFSSSLRQWQLNATQFLVPKTRFFARQTPDSRGGKVLVVESRKSTGAYIRPLIGCIDLEQTPILHWRWRVSSLPHRADGRNFRTDDQAIAIYLVAGGPLSRRGVAYRWETETPLEYIGDLRYSSTMQIRFCCVRNRTSPKGEWLEETRNVRDDFLNAFGYVPKDFALSVFGNSQHTGSDTVAELDFIEFLPPPKPQPPAEKTTVQPSEKPELDWLASPYFSPFFRQLTSPTAVKKPEYMGFQTSPEEKPDELPVPFKNKVVK